MNKEKIAILVDSGCDIPMDFVEKYDMKVLSLKIIYKDKTYSDGEDITPETIYKKFATEIPTTSTPNTYEVNEMVYKIKEQGFTKIIAICISSGLSGTYNTIKSALDTYYDIDSFVFDTKNIGIGAGIFAIWVGEKIAEGMSFYTISQELQKKVADSKIFYYMDTLDYLKAGGRIGNVSGIIGKLLDIKPIITCNENGIYYTVAKTRGKKNGIKKLLSIIEQYKDKEHLWITLLNGDARELANIVKPELLALCNKGKLIVDKQITASLAIHTGPGLLGIGVFESGI